MQDLDTTLSESLLVAWDLVCQPPPFRTLAESEREWTAKASASFNRIANFDGATSALWSWDETEVYVTHQRRRPAAGIRFTGWSISAVDVKSGVSKFVGIGHQPAAVRDGVAFFSVISILKTDLVTVVRGVERTVATDVIMPHGAPGVTPNGKWLAYTTQDSSSLFFTTTTGSSTIEIPTPHKSVFEPVLTDRDGRILLAYSALEREDSEQRQLFVIDVTDSLVVAEAEDDSITPPRKRGFAADTRRP